jgi:ABC-type Fe3+ transport system permease subunit
MAQRKSSQHAASQSASSQSTPAQRKTTQRTASQRAVPQKRRRVWSWSNAILALVAFLFLLSFSVTVVLNLRGLYYHEMQTQQLAQVSGLSE